MPMKTKDEQREYQRKWMAARRAEYFKGKFCVRCFSTERLEIHHVNPESKITNAVWSWRNERRQEELNKCEILCYKCHKKEHSAKCGSLRRYKYGCRCDLCRGANREKGRKERARRKLKSSAS